jgi:hypothetical protein
MIQEDLFAAVAPDIEGERRRRIRVALAAYAYEIADAPIMSDADYDALARRIDPAVSTGNEPLDRFFREQFAPHTGQWVRWHPGLDRLAAIYRQHWAI